MCGSLQNTQHNIYQWFMCLLLLLIPGSKPVSDSFPEEFWRIQHQLPLNSPPILFEAEIQQCPTAQTLQGSRSPEAPVCGAILLSSDFFPLFSTSQLELHAVPSIILQLALFFKINMTKLIWQTTENVWPFCLSLFYFARKMIKAVRVDASI